MLWNLQTIGELGCFISEGCVYLFLGKGTCTHEVGSPEVGSLAHAGDGRPGNGFPSRLTSALTSAMRRAIRSNPSCKPMQFFVGAAPAGRRSQSILCWRA